MAGDLGRWRGNGSLEIVGRVGEVLLCARERRTHLAECTRSYDYDGEVEDETALRAGGFAVAPERVEAALMRCKLVRSVFVVADRNVDAALAAPVKVKVGNEGDTGGATVAVVVPWARDIAEDSEAHLVLHKKMLRAAVASSSPLSALVLPRQILVVPEPWGPHNGLATEAGRLR